MSDFTHPKDKARGKNKSTGKKQVKFGLKDISGFGPVGLYQQK
jgi:hypothetical protein